VSRDPGPTLYLSSIKYILEKKETSAHELSRERGLSIASSSGFLRRLSNRGVIVKSAVADESSEKKGGVNYRLYPDLESIKLLWEIFTDQRDDLHACLTSVNWVMELILDQRLFLGGEGFRSTVRDMLIRSRTFFSLCLLYDNIHKLIFTWFIGLRKPFLCGTSYENTGLLNTMYSSPLFVYHEFFAYCIFFDKLNGLRIDESITALNDLSEACCISVEEFRSFQASEEIMEILSATGRMMKEKDVERLKKLMNAVDEYSSLHKEFESGGRSDPEIRSRLSSIAFDIVDNM